MRTIELKLGEQLHLGDDITLGITKASGDHVKIGVTAPRDIQILREELWITKQDWKEPPANWWQALKQHLSWQPPTKDLK